MGNVGDMITERSPVGDLLMGFKAMCIQLEALSKLGVNLDSYFAESRQGLRLFGKMVMGTTRAPEYWKQNHIYRRYAPSPDQWEIIFSMWLEDFKDNKYGKIYNLGLDILNVNDPYEFLLMGLIELMYGDVAREMLSMFLYENDTNIIYEAKTGKVRDDLRSPASWAIHFKLKYDTAINRHSLN